MFHVSLFLFWYLVLAFPYFPIHIQNILSLDNVGSHLSCVLSHDGIGNHQRSHALNNGHRTRHNTGIVSALGGENTLALTVVARCGLVLADGGRGLEADLEEDGHAVADTALNTARVVRLGLELGAGDACLLRGGVEGGGWHEGVVVLAAGHLGALEAGS